MNSPLNENNAGLLEGGVVVPAPAPPSKLRWTLWTKEEADIVRSMIATNSATKVGKVVNRSRSSVIGYCHRNAIQMRQRTSPGWPKGKPREHRPKKKASLLHLFKTHQARTQVMLPSEPPRPHNNSLITILDLGHTTCKWPIGDPKEQGFGFCGAHKEIDGKPYCKYHAQISTGRTA